jgi:hypothetical protein
MTFAQQNPEIRRREKEELDRLRARNNRLEKAIGDIGRNPDRAHGIVADLEEDLGGSVTPLTLENLRSGAFSAEDVANRMDEVQALLSGDSITGSSADRSGEIDADDIRNNWDADAVAEFGAEEALEIINRERGGNR